MKTSLLSDKKSLEEIITRFKTLVGYKYESGESWHLRGRPHFGMWNYDVAMVLVPKSTLAYIGILSSTLNVKERNIF